MKIMYRGVRLKETEVDWVLRNGMEYYWKTPEEAIYDIFRAMNTYKITNKLVKNGMLQCRIMEGAKLGRLQLYGSEEKYIAESYARGTPELINITLENGLVDRKKITKYLNERYGLPHVITFNINAEPTYSPEINKVCGYFIPPEFIVSIEKVDVTKKDPIHERFQTI